MNTEEEIEITFHLDEETGACTMQCGTFRIDSKTFEELCAAKKLVLPSQWAREIDELRRQYETN